ncbi:hypothetical protein [Neorhizobium galegae]|uniref:Uncharacterized protein n=1 Tax=Neorhizobium galegae bv. orientalis str. HAMBI 540 TaxID=1028800 RepID=A0A068SKW3_NEOGA|nr:hypothetical protein [Neorhizobium galegae]MCQ1856149.1 hypothetical protein [Neorhizobium galegae]CDN46847.1 Hypothetical protein RG540_CH06570 [Neorhizobium galegae bv. orientalis str. HAMBI 540]
MTIKDGPAFAVGQGFYNFTYDRYRFTVGLTRQGHPAADITFQAAQMTAMYVLQRVRNAYEFGRGLTDEDYQTCRRALQDLLLDIHAMTKPEVAA